jgi:hypothetical protein
MLSGLEKWYEKSQRPRLVYAIQPDELFFPTQGSEEIIESYKVILRSTGRREAEEVSAVISVGDGQEFDYGLRPTGALKVETCRVGDQIRLSCSNLNVDEEIVVWVEARDRRLGVARPVVSFRAKGANAQEVAPVSY